MGNLQRALGEGEAARQFYEKALQIRERLVAQEPMRADYLLDLVKSLIRTTGSNQLQRAVNILLDLKATNRLSKTEEPTMAFAQRMLQLSKSAPVGE